VCEESSSYDLKIANGDADRRPRALIDDVGEIAVRDGWIVAVENAPKTVRKSTRRAALSHRDSSTATRTMSCWGLD